MSWKCHFVPCLLLGLLAPGCYRMHQNEHGTCGPPPGQVCCDLSGYEVPVAPTECPFACPLGTQLRSARVCIPAIDAGGPGPDPIDAGPHPIDAGPLLCPPERATAACLESFLVMPDHAFELPLTFDACGCCATGECRVTGITSVDGVQTLELETTLCPDPCDCDACVQPEVRCEVPPLAAGAWNVVVNGAPAFTLPVFADAGFAPPPPACATFADEDHCALDDAPPDAWGWRPSRVCVAERFGGDVALEVESDCWGCGDLAGPCMATVEPRFTDDLPPGGEIQLAPTRFTTMCDVDCPGVCVPATRRCLVPPLVPGQLYRVWADGEVVMAFTAGEAARVCSDETRPPGG